MKGFIEVTLIKKERKVYINVRNVESISVVDGETRINMVTDLLAVKETYAELKALIEAATEPTISKIEKVERDGCEYCGTGLGMFLSDRQFVARLDGNTIDILKHDCEEMETLIGSRSIEYCPECGRNLKGE